jgi:hypothetical protein
MMDRRVTTGVPRSAPFVRIINKEIFELKSGVFYSFIKIIVPLLV